MILLLMGPPGSGKTSIGKRLASRLNYKWIDVDDHLLEPEWNCTVGEKLFQVGEKLFLKEEGAVLMQATSTFTAGSVISLTGSNPMDLAVMKSLKALKNSLFIYLDVHLDDIVKRLGEMKVDRIVNFTACCGPLNEEENSGISTPIRDIVSRRAIYYDPWFDVRIWPKEGATLDEVEQNVLSRLDEILMAYCDTFTSTRCNIPPGPLSSIASTWGTNEVLVSGLARDGGLFVPKNSLPKPTFGQLERLKPLAYRHKAHIVLEKLIHRSQIKPQKVDEAINAAFETFLHPDVVPIVHLQNSNIYLAELFHGPTGSFKDLALQILPRLVSQVMLSHERHVYLVATSGDTGGAVIDGFSRLKAEDKQRLAVFVMYPTQGISKIQKQQMVTCESSNVKVIGVNGNFDDCQRMVKKILNDEDFKKTLLKKVAVNLNTANSINWGRILPQILFHIHNYLEMANQGYIEMGQKVDLCIPTGNFGNVLSAIFAKTMDVPYDKIIVASNENKVLHDFFSTGFYDLRSRKLIKTVSPAIDILVSSNLERLLWMQLGSNRVSELMQNLAQERFFQVTPEELEKVKSFNLESGWCNEEDCKSTMIKVWNNDKYMLDPHSSVAVKVAQEFSSENPLLVCSTAHYSKFVEECKDIFESIDKIDNPSPHEGIEKCKIKEIIHEKTVDVNYDKICEILTQFATEYFLGASY